ncbi:MAG: hypothetical protein ACRYGL_17870 [Janthinobacterium lividum]
MHALGGWDTAVTVTTADDIGALTAAILFATPRIVNRVVYIAGDTLTYGQLAATVETARGRPVARHVRDIPRLTAELEKDPEDALRKYRLVFAQGRGVAWPVSDTFNVRENIAVTNVAQWLRAAGRGAGGKAA